MTLFQKTLTVNEGINRARKDKTALLIDIRTKEEYKRGHVAGAINIPLAKLENIKTRIKSPDCYIYVIGDMNSHPKTGASKLHKMGYKNAIASGVMEDHQGLLKREH